MRHFQTPLCIPLLIFVSLCACLPTQAQQEHKKGKEEAKPSSPLSAAMVVELPLPPMLNKAKDLTKLVLPSLPGSLLQPPLAFGNDPASSLRSAILNKLGIRYRFYGADDRGYDCSGFVWRVFQEAGIDFQRVAARTLWSQLPEAVGDETKQFGTLIFFNDLKHVGIVRDAQTFYHSSSSKGVTVSEFAGYWEQRITGYRRAPLSLLPHLMKAIE